MLGAAPPDGRGLTSEGKPVLLPCPCCIALWAVVSSCLFITWHNFAVPSQPTYKAQKLHLPPYQLSRPVRVLAHITCFFYVPAGVSGATRGFLTRSGALTLEGDYAAV